MMKSKFIETDTPEVSTYKVVGYDGSYPGCSCTYTVIENVTKAVANSIARYKNREVRRAEILSRCSIDISFYVTNPYDRDMGDMYGGRNLLMN